MVSAQRNPYIAGSPISGQEMFFGRDDVFEFIQRALVGKYRDNVLVLYGQRRTGKTSVMNQLPRILAPRYLCVFMDMHMLALDGINGFLWELANYIRRGLEKNYQVTLPPLARADFTTDARHAFQTIFLENVWAVTGDQHLLLMFDEAVRLEEQVKAGKLEPEIFDYLRSLMQSNPRLNFLFSLGSGLEEMQKEYALLFNVALYRRISFLDRASAVKLITEPAKDQYQVEPAAVEEILSITSGHPYFTQLVCHSLYSHAQTAGITSVTPEIVDQVLDEAVERGLAVLRHVWEDASPVEKVILSGMAAIGETNRPITLDEIDAPFHHFDYNLPSGEQVKALRSLEVREVLLGGGPYTFAVDLQRRFIRKNYPPELVWEDIKDNLPPSAPLEEKPASSAPKGESAKDPSGAKFYILHEIRPYWLPMYQTLDVTIRNQASQDSQFSIIMDDPSGDWAVTPEKINIQVKGGQSRELLFRAYLRSGRWFGRKPVSPLSLSVESGVSKRVEEIPMYRWRGISTFSSKWRSIVTLIVILLTVIISNLLGAGPPLFNPGKSSTSAAPAQPVALVSTTIGGLPNSTVTPQNTATLNPTATPAPTDTPQPTDTPTLPPSLMNATDGSTMLLVPAGEFSMGVTLEQIAYICRIDTTCKSDFMSNASPVHKVLLSNYYIAKTEVTNAMYQACVTAGFCSKPKANFSRNYQDYYINKKYAEYPMINVTWFQAGAYCKWAGGRLPTEAEWEKAARGEQGYLWPWGDEPPDATRGRIDKTGQGLYDTVAVGSYPAGASPYGALDMAGNVYEWVSDIFDLAYYQTSPRENPTGPASGGADDNLRYRSVRGGSWGYSSWVAASAIRSGEDPNANKIGVGFRCVMDAKR